MWRVWRRRWVAWRRRVWLRRRRRVVDAAVQRVLADVAGRVVTQARARVPLGFGVRAARMCGCGRCAARRVDDGGRVVVEGSVVPPGTGAVARRPRRPGGRVRR